MARFYDQLTPEITAFIEKQFIFFTASSAAEGRINLSPKGMNTFRVLAPDRVAYLDLTGSGNETAAHLLADGRLTVMFCSFGDKPLILRLYGHGSAVRSRDLAAWAELAPRFEILPGTRQIITMKIDSVQTSCGFAVPVCELKHERQMLVEYAEKKGPDGIAKYWAEKNQTSIDGLPTKLVDDRDRVPG